jgi:hypothetical protein
MIASPFAYLLHPLAHHARENAIYLEFTELASVPNHPAFTSVPQASSLPKTSQFLQSRPARVLWKRGDMRAGCAKLALRLDIEWPDWAVRSHLELLSYSGLIKFLLSSSRAQTYLASYSATSSRSSIIGLRISPQILGTTHWASDLKSTCSSKRRHGTTASGGVIGALSFLHGAKAIQRAKLGCTQAIHARQG